MHIAIFINSTGRKKDKRAKKARNYSPVPACYVNIIKPQMWPFGCSKQKDIL